MRDHSNHIQFTREQLVNAALVESGFCAEGRVLPAERVSLAQAFGRVLAADVTARNDAPTMLTCMMDSVAVHWRDFEACAPGQLPDTSSWVRGRDWQFANTGVVMPDGFDTAIRIEEVRVAPDEQTIELLEAPHRQGQGTRPAGSQLHAGDVLARAGQTVTPDLAAHLAGGNVSTVAVAAKPRVAFIPTGNELVPAGVVPLPDINGRFAGAGKTIETNSLLVRGKVEQWGGVFIPFDIVPDKPELIREAVQEACAMADIVVLNAGSSKGSDDWSCEVMEQIGCMLCHQVSHGPGRHSSLAVVDGVPVVGISGPSGGAAFTLDFYLKPLVRAYLGQDPQVKRVPVRLASPFPAGGPHGRPNAGGASSGNPGRLGASGASGASSASDAGSHGSGAGVPAQAKSSAQAMPSTQGEPSTQIEPAFFALRLLNVRAADDGTLMGEPIEGAPSPATFARANACCMVPAGPSVQPPQPGDIIHVELR